MLATRSLVLVLCGAGLAACGPAPLGGEAPLARVEEPLSRLPGQSIPLAEQPRVLLGKVGGARLDRGPLRLSLRDRMSPVKHQGLRNTCSAFALVALLEASGGERLSEQCISYLNPDGDVSFVWETFQRVQARGFLVDDAHCPYDPANRERVPSDVVATWPHMDLPGSVSARVFSAESGDDPIAFLRGHLARHTPVAFSVFLFGPFWQDGNLVAQVDDDFMATPDGLLDDAPRYATHALVAIGYDDIAQVIEVKNSWGTTWKDQGYGWLHYDYVRRFHSNFSANNPMVAYSAPNAPLP